MLDQIFFNGVIQTMDDNETIYEAIGLKDGKIAFLGSSLEALELEALAGHDLQGKLVLPGFMDTHLHILEYAVSKITAPFFDCASPEEVVARGQVFAREKGPYRGWLLGWGWNQNLFTGEQRFVTRADLDLVSTELPVVYTRVCGHIAVANSVAMERILQMEEAKKVSAYIDAETGVLQESAAFLHKLLLEPLTEEAVIQLMTMGQADLNREGITSIHSTDFMGMPDGAWRQVVGAMEAMDRAQALTVRVYEQCLFNTPEEFEGFLEAGYTTGVGSAFFRIGPLKLFSDGSLGARTALLSAPYSDDPGTTGIQSFEKEELRAFMALAESRGMQVAVHAIGDGAIDLTVTLLEELVKARGSANGHLNPLRHGIIHAQLTTQVLLEKMRRAELLAYIQPVFVPSDMGIVEARIGRERMDKVYAWKTMRDMGIRTAGSSDAPVESFSVVENIYAAVERCDFSGEPDGGWLPEEKLSVMEAVRLFTSDAAYVSFDEASLGTLEVGKLADLVVLDRNLFELTGRELLEAKVAMTLVGGRVVYEAGEV
ncbi:MAG: amidohydrolase family protein [Acidaminobacter sp.]|uniref:amidohydrolase n=1 Tax=Acidaminobacter sp. TaxID=1872102 RepID=UPI0013853A2C|nr:amidohydrolase [Acidaminobacter sp.]MZQ97690.1 amidohydrolase family protein [Acidaminobacter sp.]